MKHPSKRTARAPSFKWATGSGKTYTAITAIYRLLKTASQPLITKPTVPLKDLAMGVMMGVHDADTVSSLADRLARLNTQLDPDEQERIRDKAGGIELTDIFGIRMDAVIDELNEVLAA